MCTIMMPMVPLAALPSALKSVHKETLNPDSEGPRLCSHCHPCISAWEGGARDCRHCRWLAASLWQVPHKVIACMASPPAGRPADWSAFNEATGIMIAPHVRGCRCGWSHAAGAHAGV